MIVLKQGIYNMDCMEGMAMIPDNYFDLAIVDPPYGINGQTSEPFATTVVKPRGHKAKSNPFCEAGKLKNRALNQAGSVVNGWDVAPGPEYFKELFRVSKNQIIWDGNYFALPPTRCFVIWDKEQPFKNFSAAEYAWTSFDFPAKIYRQAATRAVPAVARIHPTQKPTMLYEFCLRHFARAGDKILDTHAGSGSCLVAARHYGLEWLGFELNPEYFHQAQERLLRSAFQKFLFAPLVEEAKGLQQNLFPPETAA